SSRRRHTRSKRDWSSDVCSSDLNVRLDKAASGYRLTAAAPDLHPDTSGAFIVMPAPATVLAFSVAPGVTMQDSAIKPPVQVTARSEERRVGKEGRCEATPEHERR